MWFLTWVIYGIVANVILIFVRAAYMGKTPDWSVLRTIRDDSDSESATNFYIALVLAIVLMIIFWPLFLIYKIYQMFAEEAESTDGDENE